MKAGVRAANTKPELLLRLVLHVRGFQFRTDEPRLSDRPSVTLPKWRIVIEVRGCFWQGHEICPEKPRPATNISFWKTKIQSNAARDKVNLDVLPTSGWQLLAVCECAIAGVMPGLIIAEVTAFVTDDLHNGSSDREIR